MLGTIWNKNTPLIDVRLNEYNSSILELGKIHNPEYFPIGVYSPDEKKLMRNIEGWWKNRKIPASREHIKEALFLLGRSLDELSNLSYGLSLSDQYWIKPAGLDITWSDVNFFENHFSSALGDVLVGDSEKTDVDLMSPDNSSDGMLPKKWIIDDKNARVLLKGGTKPFLQEPYNEIVANLLLECMDIPYVPYHLTKNNGKTYSASECFINENQEYIPAIYIYKVLELEKNRSREHHLKKCLDYLGVEYPEHFINQMLALDYMIMNTDRHWGNFGFIRDVETLKILSPAPLFDNGTSLWNKEAVPDIAFDEARTFRDTHFDQCKLITDFSGINIQKLELVPFKAVSVLEKNPRITRERAVKIGQMMLLKIGNMEKKNMKRQDYRRG